MTQTVLEVAFLDISSSALPSPLSLIKLLPITLTPCSSIPERDIC